MTMLQEATWIQARDAAAHVCPSLPSEQVDVSQSSGRVLADDCLARCDLPSFDSSAMDGWAVAGDGPWQVIGDALAGRAYAQPLVPGSTVRIATGAVVPNGTSAIIRWEDASLADGIVSGPATDAMHIRRAGEECRTGDLVAQSGTIVTPALAGFLAATGHDAIPVVRRPRIGLMLLGDELQHSGIPRDGRVRDSLGPQLPGWLTRMGAEVVTTVHIPDDLDAVVAALLRYASECDVIITTGGTAAGPRDHLHAALTAAAGSLIIDCVAVRPGHPMLLATLSTASGGLVPVIGLPGNPHSAIIGLMTFAQPIIDSMLGRPALTLRSVPTVEALRSPAGHTRLIAGNLVDGRFVLSPYGGSAMLRGLAQSTGFAVAQAGDTPAGAVVEWLPLP
jgi:molybdopterin molybdotransferase